MSRSAPDKPVKSKMDICREVMKKMQGKSRKDIRIVMEQKAGISKPCSNTFYYLIRDEMADAEMKKTTADGGSTGKNK